MKKVVIIFILFIITIPLFPQVEGESEESGMALGLSNQTIDGISYSSIALMPELNFGFLGVGFNIDIRFTIKVDNDNPEVTIFKKDWVLESGADFQDYLSLYLGKLAYLRLGHKHEDFYLKAGMFYRASLGNGTILSDYSNMQHMPEKRIFGIALDIDGNLFNFPYIGFESFIGNVAAMDVIGGRLYFRPFSDFEIPIVSGLEIAGTVVTDRDPYFYIEDTSLLPLEREPVTIVGTDFTIPLLDKDLIYLKAYTDIIFQTEANAYIYGIGGQVIQLINYGLQYSNQEENYIPEYFNAAYDLNRTGSNYQIITGNYTGDPIEDKQDLAATLGFEIPRIMYFSTTLTDLLTIGNSPDQSVEEAPHLYPSLKGILHVDNDLLRFFSADFFYLKSGIDDMKELTNPRNAVIGGKLSYYTGNTVISLIMDVKYNGDAAGTDEDPKWITNTQIGVNIKF